MKTNETHGPATDLPKSPVRPALRYEPPRILDKRSVERVTLLSGEIGPGGPPIGGE